MAPTPSHLCREGAEYEVTRGQRRRSKLRGNMKQTRTCALRPFALYFLLKPSSSFAALKDEEQFNAFLDYWEGKGI